MKVGIGFDAHAFAPGRPLVIGGVTIPSERGLVGHSDADVLSHALCDAILGAATLGDIGTHFPSSDDRWRDAQSTDFLARAAVMVRAVGLRVSSLDATVILEEPPLAPYRMQIRRVLSDVLGIDQESVSVKATTTDGLGFIGRGQGAAAMAVVMLDQAVLT